MRSHIFTVYAPRRRFLPFSNYLFLLAFWSLLGVPLTQRSMLRLMVYQRSESRIVMTQKCRIALEHVATDLSNLQAVQGDESLLIVSQDNPLEEGVDRDLISFVTLINTDPDPFLAELNAANQTALVAEAGNPDALVSDVQRIAYYIGADTIQQIADEQADEMEAGGQMLTPDSEVDGGLALFRLSTTALDVETVIQPLLESETLPTEDDEGNPIYINIVPIIDQVISFDVRYYDGEEWYESWEDTEMIPKSVVVWVTVAGENGQQQQNTGSNSITQSTMVYLPMSANFSEQTADGGTAGGPG